MTRRRIAGPFISAARRAVVFAGQVLVLLAGVATVADAQNDARRVPLRGSHDELTTPAQYPKSTKLDPQTGTPIEHDPKLSVVTVNQRSGIYHLQWTAEDGGRRSVTYQRPDRIVATVGGEVRLLQDGKYRYRYTVRIARSSAQALGRLVVQDLAVDRTAVSQPGLFIGRMSPSIEQFRVGYWNYFAPLSTFRPVPNAGTSLAFELDSTAPPGLVECRIAGATLVMTGGELPPTLADLLLGYEAWPRGRTIGPVAAVKAQPAKERLQRFISSLGVFEDEGWLAADVRKKYESVQDVDALERILADDLRSNRITTEVMALAAAIRGR